MTRGRGTQNERSVEMLDGGHKLGRGRFRFDRQVRVYR